MGASFGGIAGGMFSAIQGFISPESFVLVESIMVVSMVVLGGNGQHLGRDSSAPVLLSFVPEILRFTVEPVQMQLFGRMLIEPEVIRMLIFGFALVLVMAFRPGGLWPSAVAQARTRGAQAVSALLAASGISKRFGGVQALADVSFSITQGEIYGLIGPNGAGKTTLFNLLTGIYAPDSGRFAFGGNKLSGLKRIRSRREASAHFPEHPPLRQSISAGKRDDRPPRPHPRGVIGPCCAIRRPARKSPGSSGEQRSSSTMSALAAARMKPRQPSLWRPAAARDRPLARDRPQAAVPGRAGCGHDASETIALRRLLERIRGDGTTLLLIEHDVRLVMNVCNRVLVLDHGERNRRGFASRSTARSEGHRGIPGTAAT